jgi:hypothetical protein
LSVVIPYGMINFFPAQAVLDKADYLFLDLDSNLAPLIPSCFHLVCPAVSNWHPPLQELGS